jgi:hypothetical protein
MDSDYTFGIFKLFLNANDTFRLYGHDHMVVEFTTTYVISAYHH